jgi:transposase
MGFEPGPSKEGSWMMTQGNLVVVGIDVAKDKVDACIRSLSRRQMFPSSAEGRRALIGWLRKHKVGKAAMEASGGYERDWAKALREADIEAGSSTPSGCWPRTMRSMPR